MKNKLLLIMLLIPFNAFCVVHKAKSVQPFKHEFSKVVLAQLKEAESLKKSAKNVTACPPIGTCAVTQITSLPFTISCPGNYCLTDEFSVNSAAAIVIAANNVTIDFNSHNVALSGTGAVGVLASGVNDLTILNASIRVTSQPTDAIGISLTDCDKVTVVDAFISDADMGVFALNCEDIRFTNLHVKDTLDSTFVPLTTNFAARDCSGVVIEESHFRNVTDNLNVAGIFVGGVSETGESFDFRMINTELSNSDIFISTADGVLLQNITSIMNDPTYQFSSLQLGYSSSSVGANETLISNCTFANLNGPVATGVFFIAGKSIVMRDSLIELNAQIPANAGHTINIGNSQFFNAATAAVEDVRISNCLIEGASSGGILVTTDSPLQNKNVSIVNCQVSGGSLAGIEFDLTVNSEIKDSTIVNCGDGILLTAGSNCNGIFNNSVNGNSGIGISINEGACRNQVYYNKAFCNNCNYRGVKHKLIGEPGSQPRLGENISA